MNEIFTKRNFIIFAIGLAVGIISAGIVTGYIIGGRSAGEVAYLGERYDQLDREYSDRQRELESGLRECIGYVDAARAITERTGANASGAIQNLREASDLIKQGIAERENLKMELDNLRTALYRLRYMGGMGNGKIILQGDKNE